MPMFVFAAEKEPINVYIFKSSTCPHCQDALAFFKKLLNNKEFKKIENKTSVGKDTILELAQKLQQGDLKNETTFFLISLSILVNSLTTEIA